LSVQELRLQKEKVRVYALARELNIESKDLLDLCRQAGFDVKNQLSSLDPDQRDLVEQIVRRGGGVALAPPPKTAAPVIPTMPTPVPTLASRPARREPDANKAAPPPAAKPAGQAPATPAGELGDKPQPATPAAKVAEAAPVKTAEAIPSPRVPEVGTPPASEGGSRVPPDVGNKPPSVGTGGKVRDLTPPRPESPQRPHRKREIPRPAVARVAPLPPLKPRPPKEIKKPQEPVAQKPIARPPMEALKGGAVNLQDLLNKTGAGTDVPLVVEDDEEGADPSKGKARPGGVAGRDKRHQQRNERAKARKDRGDQDRQGAKLLLTVDEDRPQRVKQRLKYSQKRRAGGPTQPRKGKVPIAIPITVRSLSEAVGVPSRDLLLRLMNQGVGTDKLNINSTLDPDVAEAVALDLGCELDVKRPMDAEGQLLAALEQPDNPEDLVSRAPVVTIMGHVDHGKTSLLDKIRKSNVVATEAGGITQVIRAWRVEHGGHPVTFLDTPGHEAFTKMRARGAHVTDVAVIVVAADDGVMPQTEEAINHAKAAGVPIVVAINKVDLPNANLNKTRQQLYALQVIPDNMGGDTPFVETSAATGKGVEELLDTLSLVAETLLELKANSKKAARGTVLEAMLSEGEGVLATLLVQDGTLHRGDVIVCGASYGRVRAMYDDLGRAITEAGPSVPVRITGLDVVPNADDPFQVVPELATAREIADKRKARQQESSLVKREPVRLENLTEHKIAELKVILKADFRGSIEAIRKELDKFHHAEVRVRVLHAAIGGITESDVQLALTSPQDTIIVGFNVVPDDRAKALAEDKGVQIRQYDIIYHLTDDIRSALEGKLKPREEVIHLGRAVVRETFKISRVGTIAGCYVTQGTIERSAKVRLIREGVVIYPPADRTAGLESLKRFKEDVREVREGFECGLKIAGYDDVKVGDLIEAYRVEQVQRTL
jgi:translation initiation factor IF-2